MSSDTKKPSAKKRGKQARGRGVKKQTIDAAVAELAAESEAQVPAAQGPDEGPQLSVVPTEVLSAQHIRNVIEAALFAADQALTLDRLFKLFVPGELAEEGGRAQVRDALKELAQAAEGRGFELKKVASGYRMQVRQNYSPWVSRLWEEKPPRYTRALLETMALIAYKQPATRGDIEEVRGVAVSSNIMRTLLERGWIREVGQRDVPGRPSMYATTKEFLDYFNLSSLDQLPSLPEIRELVEPPPLPEPSADAGVTADAEATTAGPDATAVQHTTPEPVFADDEMVVVSEEASAEIQDSAESHDSAESDALPRAERQE